MNDTPPLQAPAPVSRDDTVYSLAARDALDFFAEEGQEISLRTFQRYCQNGILDCTKSETEIDFEWLATRSSIETRISHMKKIAKARPVATKRDDDAASRATGAPGTEAFEGKVRDLEIATQVKDQYIKQLEGDRSQLLDRIEKTSHALGAAEMQIRSLQAGRPNPEDHEGEAT